VSYVYAGSAVNDVTYIVDDGVGVVNVGIIMFDTPYG